MNVTTPIIESNHCTISEQRRVPRSWKERLFSRPWRPLQTHKTITVQVPDPHVYMLEGLRGPLLICHPITAITLREQMSDLWCHNAKGNMIDQSLHLPRID